MACCKMKKSHIVYEVIEGSIAEELEIEPGDSVLSINGNIIEDVLDYRYYIQDSYLEVLIQKPDGEEWLLEVEKDDYEDLGITFENGLMDDYGSCTNKCIFCFIDQLPKGMRETLYFKDDDARLSFLQGNYITLTNLSENDIDRIIKYHLEPINISFHTTNPELRVRMLKNRNAGSTLEKVDRLCEAGITINGQIVLCKGINDGEELRRSLRDLSKYIPNLESLSVVPAGLTKYRKGLFPLEAFTKEDAIEVLKIIHDFQEEVVSEFGTHFVHASDEWYILAGYDMPNEDNYDGYLQLENGVGMVRLFIDEVTDAIENTEYEDIQYEVSVATGVLAYPYIKMMSEKIMEKFTGVKIHVYEIINEFFGENITVAGLLTGQDLIKQLKDKELGDTLLLSTNMLRDGENVMLDNITIDDIEKALHIRVDIVKSSGYSYLEKVLGR